MKLILIGNEIETTNFKNKLKPIYTDVLIISDSLDYCSDIVLNESADSLVLLFKENHVLEEIFNNNEIKYIKIYDLPNLDLFNPLSIDTMKEYDSLLFGMSHSQCGIDNDLLKGIRVYKESAPSLDLFLHYEFYQKIINEKKVDLNSIKNIIIEMPYYAFNYDLSKFKEYVKTKIYYFDLVNRVSDLDLDQSVKDCFEIQKQLRNEDLIPKPNNKVIDNRSFIKKMFSCIVKPFIYKDKIWNANYLDTISKNKNIFSQMIHSMKSINPNLRIIIIIMPFNPLFRFRYKENIELQKKIFYEEINKYNFEVFDYFNIYMNPLLFADHCHLNRNGVIKFTRLFNSIIDGDF